MQQPRDRDRPEVVVERGLRRLGHLGAGLGAEVLHDHLLQVTVALVQLAQREQRLDALAPRLADADEDAARVRDREPAGAVDRVQAHLGQLVGRAEVRHAALREPGAGRLEHDPLRGRDLAQREQLVVVEDAGIGVRQEARLAQDEARAVRQVGGGRREPEPLELLARRPVAQLGLVAEREERLVTAGVAALGGDREHLVGREVAALAAPRRPRERAVVADVAAEVRERDEDLGRERHERPRRALAGALAQLGERRPVLGVGERVIGAQDGVERARSCRHLVAPGAQPLELRDVVAGRGQGHDQVCHASLVVAVGEVGLVVLEQHRTLDLARVAPDARAVLVEDGVLVRHLGGGAVAVPEVGVLRDQAQQDALPAARDQQREGPRTGWGESRRRRSRSRGSAAASASTRSRALPNA